MEFKHTVYINGVKRRTTGITGKFFADSDEMPCRPCSQHDVKGSTISSHATLITGGNRYCLSQKSKSIPLNKLVVAANSFKNEWPKTAPWHRKVKAFAVGFVEEMGIRSKWRSKSAPEDSAYLFGAAFVKAILRTAGVR